MKFLLVAFLAITAAASAAHLGDPAVVLVGNIIDNLMKSALEYIRKCMKDKEPLRIPDIPEQHIVDTGVDLTINLNKVDVSKASDFTVDHIENNLPGLWAKFGVSIPALHLQGEYNVKGVVESKKVQGKGTFKVDLDHFVQTGYIKVSLANQQVQMKELDLDYDLDKLNFNLIGLSIEGMTKEQIEDLLNKKFFDYLQTNKQDVCNAVERHVMTYANQLMKGKSLKQILDWLKAQIGH